MNRDAKKNGVTLIEVLIGLLVSMLIGTAVYFLLSQARYLSSTTAAKGEAKQEAQLAVRYLSRDIANSRATVDYSANDENSTVKKSLSFAGGKLSLEVPKAFAEDEKITLFDADAAQEDTVYAAIDYTLAGTTLTRSGENSKILSKHVKKFDVSENYDGKIQINLTIEKPISGSTETLEHSESAIILVREAEKVKGDKSWRQRIKKGDY